MLHKVDLRAALALADVATQFQSLLEGEKARCAISGCLCYPQQDDVAARVGPVAHGIARRIRPRACRLSKGRRRLLALQQCALIPRRRDHASYSPSLLWLMRPRLAACHSRVGQGFFGVWSGDGRKIYPPPTMDRPPASRARRRVPRICSPKKVNR